MQYQLDLSRLVQTYKSYELNYHTRFVPIAQAALQGAATRVTDLEDFYERRDYVQDNILLPAVRERLEPNNVFVRAIQLRRVTLPSKTEDEIINKLVRQQQERTAAFAQQSATIQSTTNVLVTKVRTEIELFQANKTSEARFLLETAQAEAIRLDLDQKSLSFSTLRNNLNFTGPQVIRYRYLQEIENAAPGSRLLVGFDDSSIVQISS